MTHPNSTESSTPLPKRPRRPVDGVLLLDKALGISSNRALQRARGIFAAQKAGHTGTLDPLASGLLVVGFGQATKFSQYMLDADKVYETTLQLGVRTDTGDLEGVVIETQPVPPLTEAIIESVLSQFRGEITQVPPMHSALKHDGQPLYKLARQGKLIQRPARRVHINALEVLNHTDTTLSLRVDCAKGTYIRTLGEDIGQALGCGAHLTHLRRTQVGRFVVQNAYDLDTLRQSLAAGPAEHTFAQLDKHLLGCDAGLSRLARIQLSDSDCLRLSYGLVVDLAPETTFAEAGAIRVYDPMQQFIGLASYVQTHHQLKPKRMMQTASE